MLLSPPTLAGAPLDAVELMNIAMEFYAGTCHPRGKDPLCLSPMGAWSQCGPRTQRSGISSDHREESRLNEIWK